MSEGLELALLGLYSRATPEELDDEQLAQLSRPDEDLAGVVRDLPPGRAVALAAEDVPEDGSVDQFAATQALVLGVRAAPVRDEARDQLDGLAGTLMASVGAETEVDAAPELVDVVARIPRDDPLPTDVVEALQSTLGSALVVAGDPATGQLSFSGPAARFAAMLLELARNLPPRCRSREVRVDLPGGEGWVTLVEVDVCTDLPFDHIKERVDPRNWRLYNPYFIDVQTIQGPDFTADGWCGAIREVVGPGLNGSVYTTDLDIRCVAQKQLVAVTFDLTQPPGGDGRVTVDRGFLSVTDEGPRRRVRVLKVYRIEDLDVPHSWVCPLWAMQIALAGWWKR